MASKSGTDTLIIRMKQLDHGVLDYLLRKAGEQDPEPNAGFFKDPKNILLVSYTDERLSGFLWAYILDSPNGPSPKILLYSIDVFEEFRRRGIAGMLIQELKEIARSYRCREIFVPTRKSNTAAIALYSGTHGKVENDDDVIFIYDQEALRT
jgi:ribosomal protein S18 acetylase RimI-like enzyme